MFRALRGSNDKVGQLLPPVLGHGLWLRAYAERKSPEWPAFGLPW